MRTTSNPSSARKGLAAPANTPGGVSPRVARMNHIKRVRKAKEAAKLEEYLKGLEMVPSRFPVPPPGHPYYKLSPTAKRLWDSAWKADNCLRAPWVKAQTSNAAASSSASMNALRQAAPKRMKHRARTPTTRAMTPPTRIFSREDWTSANPDKSDIPTANTLTPLEPIRDRSRALGDVSQLEDGEIILFPDATVYVQKIGMDGTACSWVNHQ